MGLWKEQKEFAEEDDDGTFFWIQVRIMIGGIFILLLIWAYLHPPFLKEFVPEFFYNPFVRYLPIGTTLAVIIGIVSILTSLQWGKNSVLWSMQAFESNDAEVDTTELRDVIKEMSLAAGIPTPSFYIVKDSDPNAFSIGTDPMDSSIVVTTGLLTMLNREELQGTIAHEISHIRNSDTRLMTTITVLFGAVLLLSGWMKRSVFLGGFPGSRAPGTGFIFRGFFFIGWLLTLLIAPLIARLVAMAVSRQREYLADASGAELTRNPKALASALAKIDNAAEPTRSFQKAIAHLCVVDPMGKNINSKEGWWADLFATHPPMKKRIMLLYSMAHETIK
jgi:heat shock protein HtpX